MCCVVVGSAKVLTCCLLAATAFDVKQSVLLLESTRVLTAMCALFNRRVILYDMRFMLRGVSTTC